MIVNIPLICRAWNFNLDSCTGQHFRKTNFRTINFVPGFVEETRYFLDFSVLNSRLTQLTKVS